MGALKEKKKKKIFTEEIGEIMGLEKTQLSICHFALIL